ncbi:MAG: hypothetical protein FJ267_16995, partial [Planctomycetes bacterium]|nr:hypothetical protein [Planctomycetota bacterium]
MNHSVSGTRKQALAMTEFSPVVAFSKGSHSPVVSAALECQVVSWGTVVLDRDQLGQIRKSPATTTSLPLAGSVARHCDEQTLAAMAAVGQSLGRLEKQANQFTDWGIVASTRYLGR